MYKVFFKDRTVFFTDDFSSSFKNNSGLFYKYRDQEELKELIDAFFRLKKNSRLYLFHNDVEYLKDNFCSCFEMVKASGGLVKRSHNEFLLIYRNGIWDLPKGKNNSGENSEEAALREVSEECGLHKLTIIREIIKTYHTYILNNKAVLKETTWYEMISKDDQEPVPQKSENITLASWFKTEDIASIVNNTYPSILEVFHAGKLIREELF